MTRNNHLRALFRTLCISTGIGCAAGVIAPIAAEDLTVERLHDDKGLSGPSLRKPQFSPDGTRITILRGREDDARTLDLWSYDAQTGEASVLVRSDDLFKEPAALSEEEKNRRERQRIYDSGIIDYAWDSQGASILFPLGGDVFLYDLDKKTPVRVTETEAFETDAKVSPKGEYVSYVRDDDLYIYKLSDKKESRVTRGSSATVRNAVAEFVAQEELDRDTGYWWSPNDDMIAYTRIDEAPVEIVERLDFGKSGATTIRQRYPFAGANNVKINLAVASVAGDARPVWIDVGDNAANGADFYIADVYWSADGTKLYVVKLSRDQKTLDFIEADPKSGETRIVFSEKSDSWVNLLGSFRALSDGGFLWGSERHGFHHIYRYGANGALQGALTKGDWPVSAIECVDEANDRVYFSGWTQSALETHLYSVSLKAGEETNTPPQQITKTQGRHGASFAGDCARYIGTSASPNQPPQTAVFDKSGERRFWLNENKLDENHPYTPHLASHITPEYGVIETKSGQKLDYQLLKPSDLKTGEKRPAIVLVYGGPHAQLVHRGWGRGFDQLLVDEGYVVFRLDNRGAANRGKAFEDPLYRAMGKAEVEDQATGARWLASQPFVDPERIGVYGWSYGGYMTLMMLSQTPDLYTAGVSGAPVTDWALYDTAYTERYMGHPERDAKAYEQSSVFAHLEGLNDNSLFLIHGMADDNVSFQNSIKLMDALHTQGKSFELMTYPGEKHGFRARKNRVHRDKAILDFFDRKLKSRATGSEK